MGNDIYYFFKEAIDILEERKAPEWITNHPEIKKRKSITKSFENFGLQSFRDKVDFNIEDHKTSARGRMSKEILGALNSLTFEFAEQMDDAGEQGMVEIHDALKPIYESLTHLVQALFDMDLEVDLNLKANFKEGPFNFRAGQPLTRIYQNIYDIVYKAMHVGSFTGFLPKLDHIPAVKAYNELVTKSQDYFVVFNSGEEGVWDVCTMSERGIDSCQKWDGDTSYSRNIIGSILSRNIGLIYFTAGKRLDKGEEMLHRCLIKIVIQESNNEPVILIDKMYKNHNEKVMEYFKASLKKRTSLPIVDVDEMESLGRVTKRKDLILHELSYDEKPYEDTKLKDYRSADRIQGIMRRVLNDVSDDEEMQYGIDGKYDEIVDRIRMLNRISVKEIFDGGIQELRDMEDETPEEEKRVIKQTVAKVKMELDELKNTQFAKALSGFVDKPKFTKADALQYANRSLELYYEALHKHSYQYVGA